MLNTPLLVPNWWTSSLPKSIDTTRPYDMAWLDNETEIQRGLFDELPSDSFSLAAALHGTPSGYRVLRYLVRHPQLALTATDLAFMVGENEMIVREVLRILAREGAVDIITNETQAFYRLTSESAGLIRVMGVNGWHTRWLNRLDRLAVALGKREAT